MSIKRSTNESGFSAVEAILIIAIVAIIGFAGWFVWHSQKTADKTLSDANKSTPAHVAKKGSVSTFADCKAAKDSKLLETYPEQCVTADGQKFTNPSQSASVQDSLVVEEWGLRFKIPSGLEDVQYRIFAKTTATDDLLAVYAKPTGHNVEYVTDYTSSSNGFPSHPVGVLYRSTEATKNRPDRAVSGKKLGGYYYYTSWAFNGMATGAGCTGLYGNDEESCQLQSIAFKLVNQGDTALLNTIESIE